MTMPFWIRTMWFGRWPADLSSTFDRLLLLVLTWQERARQRHHLATLDDHVLKDLGLSRADVSHEIRKPFWQP